MLGKFLRACKHRHAMVEEVDKIFRLAAFGRLVGNEADYYRQRVMHRLGYVAHRLAHRHAGIAEAFAYVQHKVVHRLVGKLMIYLVAGGICVEPHAACGYPFPIAVMSDICGV